MSKISLADFLLNHAHQGTINNLRVDKSVFIYEPGDEQPWLYLLDKGAVKIGSYSPEGDRVVYDVLQPGELFGDLQYLDGEVEFFEFARAVTSLSVLAVDRVFFKQLVINVPEAAELFNIAIVRRWWKAETRLLYMTRGDINARLANLRKEYDRLVVDSSGRQYNLFDLLSHQDLADLTGTTRQTVSRKLK